MRQSYRFVLRQPATTALFIARIGANQNNVRKNFSIAITPNDLVAWNYFFIELLNTTAIITVIIIIIVINIIVIIQDVWSVVRLLALLLLLRFSLLR